MKYLSKIAIISVICISTIRTEDEIATRMKRSKPIIPDLSKIYHRGGGNIGFDLAASPGNCGVIKFKLKNSVTKPIKLQAMIYKFTKDPDVGDYEEDSQIVGSQELNAQVPSFAVKYDSAGPYSYYRITAVEGNYIKNPADYIEIETVDKDGNCNNLQYNFGNLNMNKASK